MKKSRQETAATRQRIVQTAAVEFRRSGIGGTGLAEIMAAAGLTQGGFYRHFDSKDQLAAEACAAAIDATVEHLWGQVAGPDGLAPMASRYLSAEHRDDSATGCPLAALGSEIARSDDRIRGAVTEGVLKILDLVAARCGETETAQRRAMVALSTMVGALTLSRIVTDAELSATILRQADRHLAEAAA